MAGRKVLIVYAHQEPNSFNGSLKTVAVEELSKQGCSVTVSDLYAMQFEPRATRNDIVGCLHNSDNFSYAVEATEAYKRGCLSNDLIEEQKKVQEADLLIFQHGIMHFCGVKVLEPHICFAPEHVSEEKRKEMLIAWAQRLKTLWKEEPINCSAEWYFK
uniref:N-ribosyldihydronicotinamide:quinone dehydrogenase 2 n=1 Tax=Coturnix japonica TaxID=93934 RepID=A0A8C2TVG3_COTJA